MGTASSNTRLVVAALCELVASNKTLLHLDISHNALSWYYCDRFSKALKLNQTLLYVPQPRTHSRFHTCALACPSSSARLVLSGLAHIRIAVHVLSNRVCDLV